VLNDAHMRSKSFCYDETKFVNILLIRISSLFEYNLNPALFVLHYF
jgi:hypothetical protein